MGCGRPAAQLARLPTPLNASKAKKRNEVLGVLDALSTQLDATFRALGRALAQRGAGEGVMGKENVAGKENVGPGEGNGKEDGCVVQQKKVGEGVGEDEDVQLVFAIGPTPGAPKARVVFALRGLALSPQDEAVEEDSSSSEEEEEEESEEEEDGANGGRLAKSRSGGSVKKKKKEMETRRRATGERRARGACG